MWDGLWDRLGKELGLAPARPVGAGTTDRAVIATTALLVEAARLDDTFSTAERATILRLLSGHFALDAAAARRVLAEAEECAARSSQLFGFVRLILDRYAPAEREEIIEMLWEVVYADGHLDGEEDALLRRLAGLLYVPDKARGEARLRVLERRRRRDGSGTGVPLS